MKDIEVASQSHAELAAEVSALIAEAGFATREAKEAASEGDRVNVALSLDQFAECLRSLWKLKNSRERSWQRLLNTIQLSLDAIVFEEASVDVCEALRTVTEDFLNYGSIEPTDAGTARSILRRAGIDPWHSISGATLPTSEEPSS